MKRFCTSILCLLSISNMINAQSDNLQRLIDSSFVDNRDKQIYHCVKIGQQYWMAENLRYDSKGSYCYANNDSNCLKYGRLYTYNVIKEVCPVGWHLPSNSEWELLAQTIVLEFGYQKKDGDWINVGSNLKSENGWGEDKSTNNYKFSALPSGKVVYFNDSLKFMGLGNQCSWWTGSMLNSENMWTRDLSRVSSSLYLNMGWRGVALSIRCVKD